MLIENRHIPRRTFLKGLGTAIAAPMLGAMVPARAMAAAAIQRQAPLRMAFLYVPNGIHMPHWTPPETGADYTLPPIIEQLRPFKEDFLILTGLGQDKGRAHGDGPGDHARAAASFLTGVHPFKTHGANIRNGISADQVAAQRVGEATRLPSLELGCDRGMNSGNCDSGYSCAYSANISWKSETLPMAKEINPRLVFERLFASGPRREVDAAQARRERYRKSILDFVLDDARRLKATLGPGDQQKLDEYFGAVRDLEQRIEKAERAGLEEAPPGVAKPEGVPKSYEEHIKLLFDLLVLAFQGDATRIATFMIANEGSNRSYSFVGVGEGHHDLSHHGNNPEKQRKIASINAFHVAQLAHFIGKLKSIPEGDGTLLDSCMILYGSGLGDGNRHDHGRLPVLLAGRAGGTIKPGRHIRFSRETPLNNLFLSMLDRMDASTEALGDSTGRLPFLAGDRLSF